MARFKRSPEPTIDLDVYVTIVGIRRYESVRKKWAGKTVLIWSGSHSAFWRPERAGYTMYVDAAGRYSFEEASKLISDDHPRNGTKLYLLPAELEIA